LVEEVRGVEGCGLRSEPEWPGGGGLWRGTIGHMGWAGGMLWVVVDRGWRAGGGD